MENTAARAPPPPPPAKAKKRDRRKLGSRSYKNYSPEMLEIAADLVRNKKLTSREAEKQFSIPRKTICNKVKGVHSKSVGPPNKLTEDEELKIVNVMIASADFGSPLTLIEIRLFVFDYLQKNSKQHLFDGKPPGDWWVRNFIKRHRSRLSLRSTQNIKSVRAAKNSDEFSEYFSNLERSLHGVPPSNILNYDETNLQDDPGSSKCVFKRGVKYPERIMNYTKGAISVMFSITADGKVLPPYIVYKAENLWRQWCENGPDGARYNRTKSGWFDSATFEDYFRTVIFPWSQSLEGIKLVIGDNLSSHLNVQIIDLCEQNNIRFVFLPPNSTHITQPLDVAFFGPLKKEWRKILLEYKVQNPHQSNLNKAHFPHMLKNLIDQIHLHKEKNVFSGFRATGIHPFGPYQVLKRMPDYSMETKYDIPETLLQFLKEKKSANPIKKTRLKKIQVAPGTSVSVKDLEQNKLDHNKKTKVTRTQQKNQKEDILFNNSEKSTSLNEGSEVDQDTCNETYLDCKTGVFVLTDKTNFPHVTPNPKFKVLKNLVSNKSPPKENMRPIHDMPSTSSAIYNDPKKEKVRQQLRIKREHDKCPSDTSESDSYSVNDSTDCEIFQTDIEDDQDHSENENMSEDNLNEISITSMKPDMFILVKFTSVTGKSQKYYIGKILQIDGACVVASFLRKKRNGSFYWPEKEDVAAINIIDVVRLMPQPNNLRRGLLQFNVNLKMYKIE